MIQTQLNLQELSDLALESNLVPDDMFFSWNVYGGWQRDVCQYFGGPQDKVLLDIGCGPLRFGAFVLPEIGCGHFYGVEPFQPYVEIAHKVAKKLGNESKATIIQSEQFEFPLDIQVDFAIAHAVFTHLSYQPIKDCLERLKRVMKKGKPFIFTYNLNPHGRMVPRGRFYGQQMPLISVYLPSDEVFKEFCSTQGVCFEPFDKIPHPGPQRCAVITF